MKKQNTDNQQQKRPIIVSPTLPVNGCLWIVILCAVAGMTVKGCKIVNMKYEEAKAKHEMVMDSLNKVKQNTMQYEGR